MSYEGTTHRLCERGHLESLDANLMMYSPEEVPRQCKCMARFVLSFEQDETNGFYEDEPRTHPPALIQIGFDDVPLEDHRGNKYVGMWRRYKPNPNSCQQWHNLLEEEA